MAVKLFRRGPSFRRVALLSAKFSQENKFPLFFVLLWFPVASLHFFEIPLDFDHSKSLSYIKIT